MIVLPPLPLDAPGIYTLPDDLYHADPVAAGSLSSTEARRLLDSPARYRWHRTNPEEPKDHFDIGHAAHRLVLGVGATIVEVVADDWRTNAAKAQRAEARAAGHVPLLTKDVELVGAMAAALLEHPIARRLLDPEHGLPEQAVIWQDDRHSDVWRRAKVDWLPEPPKTGRLIVSDYKTCRNASAAAFGRAAAAFGYPEQHAWYDDGIRAVLPNVDSAFVFIAQETTPPYLVNVLELDAVAVNIGRERNRRAIDIYRRCRDSDEWPGYGPDVEPVSLPRWYELRHEDELAADNPDDHAPW